MFRAVKFIFLATLFRRAKRFISFLLLSLVVLLLFNLLISDLIDVSSESMVFILLAVKWSVTIILIVFSAFMGKKIVEIALRPLGSSDNRTKVQPEDKKRYHILEKNTLHSRSDLIYEKYKK